MRSSSKLAALLVAASTFAIPAGAHAQTASASARQVIVADSLRLLRQSPPADEQAMLLGLLHVIRRINVELDQAVTSIQIRAAEERAMDLRQLAPTVRSLQEHAAQAAFMISRTCGRQVRPQAYLGMVVEEADSPAPGRLERPQVFYPKVLRVTPGSPAETAGVLTGDVIVAVDGVDLRNGQLGRFVTEPGRKLTMRIERDGSVKAVSVRLAAQDERSRNYLCESVMNSPDVLLISRLDSTAAQLFRRERVVKFDSMSVESEVAVGRMSIMATRKGEGSPPPALIASKAPFALGSAFTVGTRAVLGAVLADFDVREVSKGGESSGRRFVRVLSVPEASIAHEGGLRAGDVVLRVGKVQVHSVFELEREVNAAGKNRSIEIAFERDGRPGTANIRLRE